VNAGPDLALWNGRSSFGNVARARKVFSHPHNQDSL